VASGEKEWLLGYHPLHVAVVGLRLLQGLTTAGRRRMAYPWLRFDSFIRGDALIVPIQDLAVASRLYMFANKELQISLTSKVP
jgi:hypothetical protein